jgi:hypothetical protein
MGELEVQKFLRNGNTVEDLNTLYGIKSCYNDEKSLVILNYDQIESRKDVQIARECRSLTLELNSYNIVGRGFSRFFNWGEMAEEMPLFDWSSCWAHDKEDGSIGILFNYKGKWLYNTRGSFGEGEVGFSGKSWQQIFFEIVPLETIEKVCYPKFSYVFELCTIHNKVVRTYSTPQAFLLAEFGNRNGCEVRSEVVDQDAKDLGCSRPRQHYFKSIDEVIKFLDETGKNDATYEGVVLCDINNRRWKVKNPLYLSLHKLRGEGDNLFNPKYLLPFVLAGEEAELLIYFPEVKDAFYEMKTRVNKEYDTMVELWEETQNIELQKTFAQSIVPQTKFSSILFRVRRGEGSLRDIWLKSSDLILKTLYNK